MSLSVEEYETFKQINDYLIDEGIDRFFPKFKDMLIKVNNSNEHN